MELNKADAPRISIVMPVYNAGEFLSTAIESVLEQTFDDWELIIVDDASTDGSVEVARAFAAVDARIILVCHKENEWVSAARNTGMDMARGSFIWFCDVDDTFEPNLLARCLESLESDPADMVLFGHVEEYHGCDGRFLYRNVISPKEGRYHTAEELRPHIIDLEYISSYGYPWNKLYRKEFLRSTGVRFGRDDFGEDIAFNISVCEHLETLNVISAPLYRYRARKEGSLTSEIYEEDYYEKSRRRVQMIYDQLERWGVLDDRAKTLLGALYGRCVLSAMERNCNEKSGMTTVLRKAWCQQVFSDPLFEELMPHAKAASSELLDVCLAPLREHRVNGALALARIIHFTKTHTTQLFTKLRSER